MTEAELWGLIVDYNDSLMTAMSLFLTILSGYLIVAYLSGANVTRMQSGIITVAFILAATDIRLGGSRVWISGSFSHKQNQ